MIKLSNLTKKYEDNEVLKSVSLEIDSGTIFGLIGPNGAGKTTLISSLVGLVTVDSGGIIIDKMDIKKELAYIRSISSLIPQELAFYPTLSTAENLEYFGAMLGLEGRLLQSRIDEVVYLAQLENVYTKQAYAYSGGLKRRLNIAIGLLSNPKIIYLDEPTVGIDPQSRNFILESIKKMQNKDRIIVYTSHYMDEVEFLCDKIAILHQGEIIKEGRLATLLSDSKAVIKTKHMKMKTEIDSLPGALQRLLEDGEDIESVLYGHDLERYFLQLTDKRLRD